MSTAKTRVENKLIEQLIKEVTSYKLKSFKKLRGGEFSQAFLLELSNKNVVIRINKNSKKGFEKDKIAYQKFSSKKIPIPKIKKIGEFKDLYYCISEEMPGQILENIPSKKVNLYLPRFFKTLNFIHQTIINYDGYGEWDLNLKGSFGSWEEYLLDSESPDYWNKLNKIHSYFNLNLMDTLIEKIKAQLKYLPNEKYLIHGDYGYDNVVVSNGKVTGVLDWASSK